jgi:hypothetical protein
MKTSINFWHLLLGDVQLGTLKLKWNGTTCTERNKKISPHFSKDNAESTPKKEIMQLCLPNYFESVKLGPNGYERRKPEI